MPQLKGYIIQDREQTPVAESFRAIRAKIQTSHLKTILFVSASQGGGNAMTAANTAATLAYAGKQVILADCDFRTPLLQDIFSLPNRGVTNILVENMPVERMLQRPMGIANLRVLTSGPVSAIPAELLSHPKMRDLIEQLKDLADYVIFTSSPLIVAADMIVSDACVLVSRMDGVILIVDSKTVRVHTISKVMALLQGARANIIGSILNDVSEEKEFIF